MRTAIKDIIIDYHEKLMSGKVENPEEYFELWEGE